MGGVTPPGEELQPIIDRLNRMDRQLSTLSRPPGTRLRNLVAQVQEAVANIGAAVTTYLAGGFTTGSMSATGDVTANGVVTGVSGITSTGAYNTNLTGVGGFRSAYWGINGAAGYVPSSLQFKQDVAPAEIDPGAVLEVVPVRYRYRDAVTNFGDDAAVDVGVIAEQVDELGLGWLIDYEADEEGVLRPLGFKYERLAIALLAVARAQDARLSTLEERLAGLGDQAQTS